jgi:hypothetical protein
MKLSGLFCAGAAFVFACLPATAGAANERLPVVLVSSSPAFDQACSAYYSQGNDQEVEAADAGEFCACLADELESQGQDALEFFARTYSEDLTTFIHEYPKGDAWMEASFAADKTCKSDDSTEATPIPPVFPLEAASWGGVVRTGPGKSYDRIGTLEEGEHIMLLENTGVMENGFPWFKVEIWGSREGYQWGGIICGLNAPVEGAYEVCTAP